ncbi:ATP-binding protein [Vibrio campbellii]|nr:ATP-binding protein [Vibrio campbellii]
MMHVKDWQEENPHFIKTIEVEGLLSRKNVYWELGNVNVLVGQNGSGKSTILELTRFALLGPHSANPGSFEDKFNSVTVTFNNGNQCTCVLSDPEEHEDKMLEAIRLLLEKAEHSPHSEPEIERLKNVYDNLLVNRESESRQTRVKAFLSGRHEYMQENGKNDLFEYINLEFISTFDMILLSKEEQDKNSEEYESYSQLDILISKELNKLSRLIIKNANKTMDQYSLKLLNSNDDIYSLSKSNMNSIHSFLEKLNELFNGEDKEFSIDNTGLLKIRSNAKEISHKQLSSGEKQMLYILLKTVNTSDKPTIIFLDEPEISMHLNWQEQLIDVLRKINPHIQIVAVSHSPALVMKGWLDSYSDMKDITTTI